MEIKHPEADTVWLITKSRVVNHPESIACDTLEELRNRVSHMIREGNEYRDPKKRIGHLNFKYEIDNNNMVTVVHVYFLGYMGKPVRAMKLERQDA